MKEGTLINLIQFSDILNFKPPTKEGENGSITFQGGATFVDLCHYLSTECNPPCALKQVPSPLFVTVSGALATGTHGSGIKNKAIGAHVQDIEFVAADGKLLKYDRNVAKYHKGIQGGVTAVNVSSGHVGMLGVVSEMTMDVVPYFEGHNFFLWMPLQKLIDHFPEIVGAEGKRPLVDSHSILVNWKTGTASLQAKHWFPHYDPKISAKKPDYGNHPFARLKWEIITPYVENSLVNTLKEAGVEVLEKNNKTNENSKIIVKRVIRGSIAQECGVKIGWVLAKIGRKDVTNWASAMERFEKINPKLTNGRAVFIAEGDTSNAGKIPKVPLTFEDPSYHIGSLQEEEEVPPMIPGFPPVNMAYRGAWHDTVPAWALDQPLEDGPECDCGQQSEFFIPVENAVAALEAAWDVMKHWSVATHDDLDAGCFVLSEIRSIKGDSGFLSCTPHDTMSIHLSWSPSPIRQTEIWTEIIKLEKALAEYGARPHWGKIYTASFWSTRFPKLYKDRWTKFHSLVQKTHDPNGKFQNKWIKETMMY